MKRIGITGGGGFLGQHARFYLHALQKEASVVLFPREAFNNKKKLQQLVSSCDAIMHMAGINRAENEAAFKTNVVLAQKLVDACQATNARPHILFASSTHASGKSAYGKSKKEAAKIFTTWARESKARATIFILPHIFGEFCKPFYNSAVATLCYQLAKNKPSEIKKGAEVELLYVRDAVAYFYRAFLKGKTGEVRIAGTPIKLQGVYAKLKGYRDSYIKGTIPKLSTPLESALFTTLQSHLFWKIFPQSLEVKSDDRGDLYEIVRHNGMGQMFFSTTKKEKTRGNHYHTRKFERFCVVEGKGKIRLRKLLDSKVHTFKVNGTRPVILDMPTYYIHNLINIGEEKMRAVFWISEQYDSKNPDTYYENV